MNLRNIGLFIVFFILCGCAAQINDVTKSPVKPERVVTESIFLDVSFSGAVAESKDLSASISELKALIAKNFNGSVLPISSAGGTGTALKVTFEHYRHVSGLGRFMAGVMVGDAELRLNAKVIDLSTGKVLSDSTLDTRSEFSEGIFGATTSRQLEAMSKKIVQLVSHNENLANKQIQPIRNAQPL